MRRLYPYIVSSFLFPIACGNPPKPEKAQDLEKIQPKDSAGDAGAALGAIPDGPIATVNGVEIPNAKFREIYDLKVKKYADRGREIPASADRRYRKSIVERLIYHEVLKQEAESLGVKYDEAALKEREEQQKRGIRDWDKHLERRGETEASLREMYIAELREKAILDKSGKLKVTPEEIEEDYQKIKGNWKSDQPRVRASHILIPVGPAKTAMDPHVEPGATEKPTPEGTPEEQAKWDAEAKAKAEEIYKLVTAPDADFAAIAKDKSTGPSAAKGGDISIFTADRMAEEFSKVAFEMNVGDVSKPVKTKFGYHIIKLTGKWPAGELPKEALEDQIVSRLEQRKLHQGRRELKDELLAKYTIVDNVAPTLGPEPEKKAPSGKREIMDRKGAGAGARRGGAPAAALKIDGAPEQDEKKDEPEDPDAPE
ncbi:MAG: peptidylprolyl isomerase [Deltaproteobacteria bacterium]|nr:peptidylprolyl isomerase [Deltaproteobacteria bacterium]MBK8237206.1 peptidylprolyl isomerase [Deltaproteobacteria bacterium]MBK8718896.1 peptidylprolyl isomerase [Deltaproteobacteria bacterium]MBP7289181.1 peptidylprolyl isomerase [Nannocystaceae bacterium]